MAETIIMYLSAFSAGLCLTGLGMCIYYLLAFKLKSEELNSKRIEDILQEVCLIKQAHNEHIESMIGFMKDHNDKLDAAEAKISDLQLMFAGPKTPKPFVFQK